MVYGLFRALPSDRAFLPLSPADRSTGLAPASGRQDHTALPSASAPFVKSAACVHRIPPHVRDDRETPLERRRDTNCNNPDSTWRSSKILKIRNRRSFSCRPLGQLAHNARKKSIIAPLTSDARSCWVQWPQSASMTLPRSCGTLFAKLATTRSMPGNASIKSRSPAM